jgi:hypothetical protein
VNLYGYTRNNPANRVDPFGLEQKIIGSRNGQPIIYDTDTNQYIIGYPNSYTDPLTACAREAAKNTLDSIDNLLDNPLANILDGIPPGMTTGYPPADTGIQGSKLVRGYWKKFRALFQR